VNLKQQATDTLTRLLLIPFDTRLATAELQAKQQQQNKNSLYAESGQLEKI